MPTLSYEEVYLNIPNASELALLKSLWKHHPKTARELHNDIGEKLTWSYSTTRKVLERMGEKDLVAISNLGNKKIYRALAEKVPTLAYFAKDFASRVLELDEPIPATFFGSSQIVDDDEIAELEALLHQRNDIN